MEMLNADDVVVVVAVVSLTASGGVEVDRVTIILLFFTDVQVFGVLVLSSQSSAVVIEFVC